MLIDIQIENDFFAVAYKSNGRDYFCNIPFSECNSDIKSFEKILTNSNLIDSYRKLYPEKVEYSFWSYMRNSREKNIGWRIDYFFISSGILEKVKKASIINTVYGSDHCPIELIFK